MNAQKNYKIIDKKIEHIYTLEAGLSFQFINQLADNHKRLQALRQVSHFLTSFYNKKAITLNELNELTSKAFTRIINEPTAIFEHERTITIQTNTNILEINYFINKLADTIDTIANFYQIDLLA